MPTVTPHPAGARPPERPLSAFQWLTGLLDAVGSQPLGRSPRQCPAHRDSAPSLTVREIDGRPVLKCHAGCDLRTILRALRLHELPTGDGPRLPPADYAARVGLRLIFPPVERRGHPAACGYRLEAVHDYGPAVLERWRHPHTGAKELIWDTVRDGRRIPGLFGVTLADLPLYREREIRQGTALGEPVLLVESESSVDALRGWYATTWAGGAGSINIPRLRQVLHGYPWTVAIPDHDDGGLKWLAKAQAAGLAPHVLMPPWQRDARNVFADLGPAGFRAAVLDVVGGRMREAA